MGGGFAPTLRLLRLQGGQLREDEPHPVAELLARPKLGQRRGEGGGLGGEEAGEVGHGGIAETPVGVMRRGAWCCVGTHPTLGNQ